VARLKPASWPRGAPLDERLLLVDAAHAGKPLRDARLRDLPSELGPGDLLVVNDAATLPASFTGEDGELELRLLSRLDNDQGWQAVLFGRGDFHTRTEERPLPRAVQAGERLAFGELHARVTRIDARSPRLIDVEFEERGAAFWRALYGAGRVVQYAHVPESLALWHVQSHFAARPWALEMPSAGRPLTFALLQALAARGVALASLTHAAGLSSLGSAELDALLPLPERYSIPEETARLVAATRAAGGRVIAVGTTVVRALESSAARHGSVLAGEDRAELVIAPGFEPRVTGGLLTGLHERGTSHFALLQAFAPRALLERALDHAAAAGYLQHEFGDSWLVLARSPATLSSRPRSASVRQAPL
jgi:S-adenosylmethionine:tRNA ribosyltransferase-isomerase